MNEVYQGLEPDPAERGTDADESDGHESVSLRTVPVALASDNWEPWKGEVPLNLIVASQLQKLAGARAWPQ